MPLQYGVAFLVIHEQQPLLPYEAEVIGRRGMAYLPLRPRDYRERRDKVVGVVVWKSGGTEGSATEGENKQKGVEVAEAVGHRNGSQEGRRPKDGAPQ